MKPVFTVNKKLSDTSERASHFLPSSPSSCGSREIASPAVGALMEGSSPVVSLEEHLPPHPPPPPPSHPAALLLPFLFCDQDKGAVILELLVTMATDLHTHTQQAPPPFLSSHSQVWGPSGLGSVPLLLPQFRSAPSCKRNCRLKSCTRLPQMYAEIPAAKLNSGHENEIKGHRV